METKRITQLCTAQQLLVFQSSGSRAVRLLCSPARAQLPRDVEQLLRTSLVCDGSLTAWPVILSRKSTSDCTSVETLLRHLGAVKGTGRTMMAGIPMCHCHMHFPAVECASGGVSTHRNVMHCKPACRVGSFSGLRARQSGHLSLTTRPQLRRKRTVRKLPRTVFPCSTELINQHSFETPNETIITLLLNRSGSKQHRARMRAC